MVRSERLARAQILRALRKIETNLGFRIFLTEVFIEQT